MNTYITVISENCFELDSLTVHFDVEYISTTTLETIKTMDGLILRHETCSCRSATWSGELPIFALACIYGTAPGMVLHFASLGGGIEVGRSSGSITPITSPLGPLPTVSLPVILRLGREVIAEFGGVGLVCCFQYNRVKVVASWLVRVTVYFWIVDLKEV